MNGVPHEAIGRRAVEADARPQSAGVRFERFLREHRDALIHFLRGRTASEEDAQDAAQESLAQLMRYREEQPVESWKPLLYRIAVNVAHNQQRRAHARCDAAHVPYEEALLAMPSDALPPDEQLGLEQTLARIGAIVRQLPPRCREIYLLSRIDGMSYPQIALHCGISLKAVEKQMTKALGTLRDRLGVGDSGAGVL